MALITILMVFFIGNGKCNCEGPSDRKVAIFVLDGADWKVINQLRNDGEIPNINRMIENGASANLSSSESFTPQSTTKMATGMSTENISVNRSWSFIGPSGNQKRLDSRAVENRRFWSYMNQAGIETGIYSWVLTWPVEEVNGFMISGVLTGNLNDMTYPEELEVDQDTVLNSILGFKTYNAAKKVIQQYEGMDVLAFNFILNDRMQHNYWKFLDKEEYPEKSEYRDNIYDNYREVDELIGMLGSEYTVILVSDHGFHGMRYVRYDSNINPTLHDMGLVDYMNNSERQRSLSLDRTSNSPIYQEVNTKRIYNKTHYGFRLTHVNEQISSHEIEENLSQIYLKSGKKLFPKIEYKEGYFEVIMHLDPDSMGEGQANYRRAHTAYGRGKMPIYDVPLYLEYRDKNYTAWIGSEKNGDHTRDTSGIFIASGEGISQNTQNVDIPANKIAPLLLYLKGVPIPENMDGSVPKEILEKSYLRNYPITNSEVTVKRNQYEGEVNINLTEETRIEKRLQELGYLNN